MYGAILGLALFLTALCVAAMVLGVSSARRELPRVRAERDLAAITLDSIEESAALYTDFESPLAAAIRTQIRDHRKRMREIR